MCDATVAAGRHTSDSANAIDGCADLRRLGAGNLVHARSLPEVTYRQGTWACELPCRSFGNQTEPSFASLGLIFAINRKRTKQPRQNHCMVESDVCHRGVPDRHATTRVSGSRADLWRDASATNSEFVWFLLQSVAKAFIAAQGCADWSNGPAILNRCCRTPSVSAALSLRTDLIFGKGKLEILLDQVQIISRPTKTEANQMSGSPDSHFAGGFAANSDPRRHIRPFGSCHSFSVACR